ncbi:helix-turn-helix transcriptional regulator [Streptomyces aureocirculatus]|uniref:helix-turn-helix transcriptional regulator n=1 Tax=Streptomyces aureocirculatus TaxID=67275 RepID=UPI001CEC8FD3|nr:helix-turn-helix transcriptional regulator [Streptomyces aureocirculatus]
MAGRTDRPGRELFAAVREKAGVDELAAVLSRWIAPIVPHDASILIATSPAVGLGIPAFSFWHQVEPGLGQALMHRFYAGQDPLPAHLLARLPLPVGVVRASAATEPPPASPHPAPAALGVGCELRVLLRDARGGVWGLLGLLRSQGGRTFDGDDIRRAARLGPVVREFLRAYVISGPLTPAAPAPPPGVVIVGPDGGIRAGTPQAGAWHERLRTCGVPEWAGPPFLAGLASHARAHGRGHSAGPPLLIGPAASYGTWIGCHAQLLEGAGAGAGAGEGGEGDVAVVLHAPAREHLLPSFCDWYGITTREREVVHHLCEGTAPKQIARQLRLSAHTVNDHIKSVLRKTGAAGRDELSTALT